MRSFERTLRMADRSPRTSDQVSDFTTDQLARHKPTTAAVRFRGLRRFFGWMVDEEIITESPMHKMPMPSVPEEPVPVLTDADLTALLKATSGPGFEQRRDHAMFRLSLDTGVRLSEMAGRTLDAHDVIHVIGKGSHGRAVPFGPKTGTAIDRYLRDRRSTSTRSSRTGGSEARGR